MSKAPLSEDDLIATFFAPLAGPGALGLRDDAACMAAPPGADLVVTVDALVAGVHFFADDPADAIARKALRVNLSDLAAKGAAPLGFLLTLALPAPWPDQLAPPAVWLAAFARALGEDSAAYGCPLLGGDTVKTPGPLTLSVTAFGQVPTGRMVARTAARPGDLIAVTGTIGDAALGLRLRLEPQAPWIAALAPAERAHLVQRYLVPQPRNVLAGLLRADGHAGMDVSDGLVGDLEKMMRVSGVSARVALDRVPLSDAARHAIAVEPALFETAMTGGDDYEILLTAAPAAMARLQADAETAGVALSVIGEVRDGTDAVAFCRDGAVLAFGRRSYSHF
ncbi:thiamine-phosphate kinase [Chelatococcus asaccharovorans]|uniref:thiamine-phosphate kinase n=1 Tax=Chelatococcus asaccharovorans TaxID=28210 RepID=UPI00224C6FA2|nr:thiamine-phosphate kinase [Chelatococcus asaccharovorans]CAH1668527.1 Thiamine-monophosphate kinase [Chelatococcus asaccharovorans]CAH1680042.1 Thiamine-monophosphate kinase [Chelatococcus asaccharovorans]